jgi:hypothetical protein
VDPETSSNMAGISALSRDRVGFVGEIAEIGYRAVEHAVAADCQSRRSDIV